MLQLRGHSVLLHMGGWVVGWRLGKLRIESSHLSNKLKLKMSLAIPNYSRVIWEIWKLGKLDLN